MKIDITVDYGHHNFTNKLLLSYIKKYCKICLQSGPSNSIRASVYIVIVRVLSYEFVLS